MINNNNILCYIHTAFTFHHAPNTYYVLLVTPPHHNK